MKTVVFIFLASFFACSNTFGQSMEERERQLVILLNDLRSSENNQQKAIANKAFKSYLEETIALPGAFDYPFSKLTTLGSLKSPDNIIRLFNWNVEQDDQTQKYYCYILRFDPKKKEYDISELKDNSVMLPAKPTEILEADMWYGALYYRILPIDKGSKTAYTLLGWDGNTSLSSMKVMDVLYFAGKSPRLGSPVFKHNNETLKRVFFEHSKKTTMYLNYDEDQERIILDHLSPETPSMKGIYSFYVPDLSYDAYELRGNKWYLKEDVIGVNKQTAAKITVSRYDEKSDKIVEKEIKNKWIDPSDMDAPAGGAQHVATKPEQEDGVNEPEVKKEKISRKDRKNSPKSYNPLTNKKAKRKK